MMDAAMTRRSLDLTPMAAAGAATFRAIVQDRYGGPETLAVRDVPAPAMEPDSVLVGVRASSVNALDWHMIRGEPYVVRLTDGLRRPKEPRRGVDVAGIVEAVGPAVTAFRPGDEVFGARDGAFAELVRGRERNFVHKPGSVSFEAAAAVPVAAITALQAIRDRAAVQPGESVLVTGANGGVGTFAVQIAKALGAVVTASARAGHGDLLRTIGADDVVNASAEDVTRSGRRFDAIVEIAGRHSLRAFGRILAPTGRLVIVGAPAGNWIAPLRRPLVGAVMSRVGSPRFIPFLAKITKEDLEVLRGMLESGSIRPVIDSTWPLAATADAVRRIEGHGLRGKVVITV
jgi:NADPH:quinone reductase-like Zn-dependent oxidoreductase